MKKRSLLCVILAAGKGTRMKSDLPKVLHAVAGEPMLRHVIRAAESLSPDKIVVVIGPDMDAVANVAKPHDTVIQVERLGTGHAVKTALTGRDITNTDVLVLIGDAPLVPTSALCDLITRHRANDAPAVTILGMKPECPTGYGRLITDQNDYVIKIVEETDATTDERALHLCNSGMMIFTPDGLMTALNGLGNTNAKGEYYLTDVVASQGKAGGKTAYTVGPSDDLNGVNDRVQLAGAESRMQQKLRERAMRGGVTMVDPNTVYLSADTVIGQDITIEPNVVIGPGVRIDNGVVIKANCYIAGVHIGQGAEIGPFVHIRPDTVIGPNTVIANFVEIKKSTFAAHAKVSQFSCIVDADIGAYANVGAGTIISNWNGVQKFRSTIGDYAFVGGNATLVSPVHIHNGAFVTAGSVITDDIATGEMGFGRARQVNKQATDTATLYATKQKKKVII